LGEGTSVARAVSLRRRPAATGKTRAAAIEPPHISNDGITAYLDNGGTIENAQLMAAHESPRTTKLYDRTGDEITLDEVERIAI
jgi:hypothetical protein